MDIRTKFMGKTIESPVIAGSCGCTSNIDDIKRLEDAGIGAVILKSLFEEQIAQEIGQNMRTMVNAGDMADVCAYVAEHSKQNCVENYLKLIRNCKESVKVPVIASVNCVSNNEWMQFASQCEEAGADGIELNMFILPANIYTSSDEVEQLYENTIQIVKRSVQIPISLKISPYSASLAKFCQRLSWMGISNLNLFNRFMNHDIDLDTLETKPAEIFSVHEEVFTTMRWTAILAKLLNCPITGGCGVHEEDDVIKLLLCGASTVQVVSALYQQGFGFVTKANERLRQFMEEKHFSHISDFQGRLAVEKNEKASSFHRMQFMKYYSGIE